MSKKINISIVGATGYVGLDLVYLLSKHPKVNIIDLCAQKNLGKSINYFDKRIKKKLPKIVNLNKLNWVKTNIVFLSLPNGEAQKIIKKFYFHKHIRFIDLSGDFRIENPLEYKKWYKINHNAPRLIKKSIYSISEFVKKNIKKFRIISNPGCYPTSIQLPLIPLLKSKLIKSKNIIIDSKSGYSGAGKNYKKKFNHLNFSKSIFAYSVEKHKHMAELDQEFKKLSIRNIEYNFNPHLLPFYRGILSTIYLELSAKATISKVYNQLKQSHKKNKFVKIYYNKHIGSGNVSHTNICEISICKTRNKNKIVILSVIDNLIKGASGQAIQNMNILLGYNEGLGLK